MWLSDADRNSLSPDEAKLYQQVYGQTAYLAVDADNNMSLTKTSDIPADELSTNTVASLQLA